MTTTRLILCRCMNVIDLFLLQPADVAFRHNQTQVSFPRLPCHWPCWSIRRSVRRGSLLMVPSDPGKSIGPTVDHHAKTFVIWWLRPRTANYIFCNRAALGVHFSSTDPCYRICRQQRHSKAQDVSCVHILRHAYNRTFTKDLGCPSAKALFHFRLL